MTAQLALDAQQDPAARRAAAAAPTITVRLDPAALPVRAARPAPIARPAATA